MRLSDEQLTKLSDISSDLGVVAVASVVLPALLDKFKILPILLGGCIAIILLVTSLWLLKGRG
ncbi:MAG: hypothetical protein AAB410_03875 [Patescibacteria group bacterium]